MTRARATARIRRRATPTLAPHRHVDIDLARLKRDGFVTPDAPKSQIADEFRVIKRPIIRNARENRSAPSPRIGISSW